MRINPVIVVFFISFLLINCVSVEQYNQKLASPIPVEKLQKDINFVQHKLQKLHPSLYLFITNEQLNAKFDSVRKSITKPLTSKEFYFALSPVVASVRQGHMGLGQLAKRSSKSESQRLKKSLLGPIGQLEMEWFDNKLFVIKNKSKNKNIKLGSEVVSLNTIKPQDIYSKYSKTTTSDGFNTTFLRKAFAKRFSNYITYEIGIQDSISYVFKHKDSVYNQVVRRILKVGKPKSKIGVKSDSLVKPVVKIIVDKAKLKAEKKFKRKYGYDAVSKEYSKDFKIENEVAILKIRDFSKGNYGRVYFEIFDSIKKLNIKNLVIDLRDNPGGRVVDIVDLYSYLTDKDYTMFQKATVTSKTSLWKSGVYSKLPKLTYPIVSVFYPFYMATSFIKSKKDDSGLYKYALTGSKRRKFDPSHFTGKIYVLINGGSFSAASIISAVLKENKSITFVGEETGGNHNGNVAGLMPVLRLPNSKLPIRIGLMELKPMNETGTFGRGVFPDKEIFPTIQDKIDGKDPEMEWILEDVKIKR